MLKYVETEVVFREIPDEVTLAINISGCPIRCPDCHSKHLWEDVGKELTDLTLGWLLCMHDGITCVAFMGGDNSPEDILHLARLVKNDYPSIKVAWYSGKDKLPSCIELNLQDFDYIKLGPYIAEKGPLNNPNTNQRMLARGENLHKMSAYPDEWYDITDKFWRKNDSKNN